MKTTPALLLLLMIAATASSQGPTDREINATAFCKMYGGTVEAVNISTAKQAYFCYIGNLSCEIVSLMDGNCINQRMIENITPIIIYTPIPDATPTTTTATIPSTSSSTSTSIVLETTTTTLSQILNMTNPAATYCLSLNGSITINNDAEGNQRGVCTLPTGYSYDEWELYRRNLPPETTTTETTIAPSTTLGPRCGNGLQEIGEECDTNTIPCGAGNFVCRNCKCIKFPDKPATTSTVKSSSGIPFLPQGITSTHIILAIAALVIVAIALVWHLGKEEDPQIKK